MIVVRRYVATQPVTDDAGEIVDSGGRMFTITSGREVPRKDGGVEVMLGEYWIGEVGVDQVDRETFLDAMALAALQPAAN